MRGYRQLASYLGCVEAYGRDTPIDVLAILESNGEDSLSDLCWVLPRATEADPGTLKPLFKQILKDLRKADLIPSQRLIDVILRPFIVRSVEVTIYDLWCFMSTDPESRYYAEQEAVIRKWIK